MKIDLNNLQMGDVFYECEKGTNMKMTVVTPVVFENNQWKWQAKSEQYEFIDYLVTKGYEYYGPKIYSRPMYSSKIS